MLSLDQFLKLTKDQQDNLKYRRALFECSIIIETLGLFAEKYEAGIIVSEALDYIEDILKED